MNRCGHLVIYEVVLWRKCKNISNIIHLCKSPPNLNVAVCFRYSFTCITTFDTYRKDLLHRF